MSKTDPSVYGPVIAELLRPERLAPLGPGSPNVAVRAQLQALTVERAFAHARVIDRSMADGCCAALWLYHDFLDESHKMSQDIDTTTGSYWHGILHRREPDAGNAAYWFRRVGEHPIFASLANESRTIGLHSERWDPFAFIQLCEKQRGTGTEQETQLRQLQLREWELLFDWCYRKAVGAV